MLEDSKHRFWINTDEGLSLFNRQNQVFSNYYPDSTVMPVLGINYTQMAEDDIGNIWIGGYYDILIFDPETKKFKKSGWYEYAVKSGAVKYEKRNSISQSIVKKSKHELWLLTVYGLFSVHTPTMKFTWYPNHNIDDYFAFYISCIDESGVLWITTYDQCFYTFNPNNNQWQHQACPPKSGNIPDQILDIHWFGKDTLLMTRMDKIFLYSSKAKTFSPFEFNGLNPDEVKGTYNHLFFDGDNFYFLKSEPWPFVHVRKKQALIRKSKIPLPFGFINNQSLYLKSGKILTGDWDKGRILICDNTSCNKITDQSGSDKLGSLQLYYVAANGKQYFSTSKGIFLLDELEYKTEHLLLSNGYVAGEQTEFRNFVGDQNGNIYVRERSKGIFKIKKESDLVEYFDLKINDSNYSALYFDKLTGKLWLAAEKGGFYVIDPNSKMVKNYPLLDNQSTKKGFVNDISGDKFGNVLLLMPGRGLMKISSKNMKAKLFTTNDGLLSDAVRYGQNTDDGFFWFTSESGIMAFDPETERIHTFSEEPDSKLFTYRIYLDKNGNISQNLYPGHIVTISKNSLNKISTKGTLYLKEVKLFGRVVPNDSIYHLDYNENNLSFTFGFLNLSSAEYPDLEYAVNKQSWQSMEDMSMSMYNMPPGSYALQIRIKYQPEINKTVYIVIKYPWWQSWWFYTSVFLLLTGFGYWAYKKRISNLLNEEAEKNALRERIAQTEMAALRAQMNPHFIFNCLNSINRFILVNDTDAASQYLTRFSRLIRLILDSSKEDFISLDRELVALKLYMGLEAMRFQDSFDWEIIVSPEINTENIIIPPLLLQPYVENAIWHGLMQAPPDWGPKKLFVRVLQLTKPGEIQIEICDNGIGRKKAAELKSKTGDNRKSYGIALTTERLNMMDKVRGTITKIKMVDLISDNGLPEGTKVIISITQP